MYIRCMNCMNEYDDKYEICPHCGFIRGTKPKEIYHLKPETILNGRYIIGVVVGYGGFGIIYKAWDAQLEKVVAVKEYFPSVLVNRAEDNIYVRLYSDKGREEFNKGLERFIDEAKSTAKFSKHPNIVNVFDFFEENGTAYIVMEFLDGISLKKFIKENGNVDYNMAVNTTLSVLDALKAIHKEKILHRDISPDNIFLCIPDKVKVIDFGAARISDEEAEKTRSIILKQGYAPPEQYRRKSKQGPWTDIYALGATLYNMLTGITPDEASDRVVDDELKEPKLLRPDIPEYLNNTIMTAMSVNPELRFQNASQMKDAILEQKKVTTLAENLRRRKRKRFVTISIAAVIILIGTFISLFIYDRIKFDAKLKPATVTVWLPFEEGDDAEAQFLNRLENFKKDYPHIDVEIRSIPKDEYEKVIMDAAINDELPTLFVSTYADERIMEETVELDEVFRVAKKDDLYFMKDYKKYFPEKNKVPTGLNVAVIYENNKVDVISEENSFDSFSNSESRYYIAGIDDYSNVQKHMSGKYSLSFDFKDDNINACFTECWSVSDDGSHDEQEAGKRIISYLLGETGQDVYYVQDDNGIPLNKNVFMEYIDVNYELEILEDKMSEIKIDKSDLCDISEKCDIEYELLK